MKSFRATVSETKIVALYQVSLQKKYMCLFCKSSLVPNEDGIIKCSCGVIESADAATPNKNAKLTILDENKRRIELQVNLE